MTRSRVVRAMVVIALLGSAAAGSWSGDRATTTFPATVIAPIDGDTIDVELSRGRVERVRILNADTPETKDRRTTVQCFGPEASAYTARRLTGRRVVLELDVEHRDKYGRLLAYVSVDGVRYGDELLRNGYARVLIIDPNTKHGRAAVEAELDARANNSGLWGAC
jgi:micrococcal nuclease